MTSHEPDRPGAQRDGRLAFIHGLRGIAASLVVIFHLYDATPVADHIAATLPAWIDLVVRRGFLGVDLFFVISGFVICLTLHGRLATLGEFGRFFLRRQLRLDPPYWTAIALSISSALVVNHLRPLVGAPVPSLGDVIAHLFYLQGFLGIKDIVGVFWTLCLEIQFYLFFGAVILGFRKWSASGQAIAWIMLPLYVVSIGCFWGLLPNLPGLFLPRWFEFFTGVILFLFWRRQVTHTQLAVYLGTLLAVALLNPDTENGIALLTTVTVLCIALVFVLAIRAGGLQTWLGAPVLRYLGTISYSLYLMHAVVGIRALKLLVHPDTSLPAVWGLYAGTLVLSVAASDIVYRLIERPSMNLSHRLKWRSNADLPRTG